MSVHLNMSALTTSRWISLLLRAFLASFSPCRLECWMDRDFVAGERTRRKYQRHNYQLSCLCLLQVLSIGK